MSEKYYEKEYLMMVFNPYSPDSTPGDSLPSDERPLGKNKSSGNNHENE